MPDRMCENMPDKMTDRMSAVSAYARKNVRQNVRQIECRKECQIECHLVGITILTLSYFIKSSHDLETKVSVCACQTRVETSDWARILVHNRMHGNNCRHPENIIAAPKKQQACQVGRFSNPWVSVGYGATTFPSNHHTDMHIMTIFKIFCPCP